MMLLKLKSLKFMKLLIKIIIFHFLIISQFTYSQVLENRIKIDGVSSVIGDYVILDSDIDKMMIEIESQGVSTKSITRCELLGKLMEDKLYAHHAIQDSIEVSDQEVYDYVDQSISYFIDQLGSIEKVLGFYKKSSEISFRQELYEINKTQRLSSLMQSSIVDDVEITPEEVRQFFESIPKIELPVFGTELEISQIVIQPKVSEQEEKRIINQLLSFKSDVEERGLSFSSKAILYSQDPGSRSNGGKYTLNRKRPRMVKEFRDIAFALQEGEISEPFKTDFGWHILVVDKIRGQEIEIKHILLTPKIDASDLDNARAIIDTLRTRINDGDISFEAAAYQFSNEKETRLNGGALINPATGDKRFELTKMDPLLYNQVRELKDNEISSPFLEEDRSGLKKYKILKVTNRFDEHKANYSRDYTKIKDLALKEKQVSMIKQWMDEKIESTYININSDYKNCNFKNRWVEK